MPNPLEFILKLTDMLTPGMRQAARISESSASKITQQFENISKGGKRMSASVDELRSRLDAINKVRFSTTIQREFDVATRAANRLERQLERLDGGKKGGGMLSSIVGGNLISGGISRLVNGAMSGVSSILGGGAKRETDLVGLKTFLGEAGANEAYANINKDAAATPFDTNSLLMSNRALISAGASAKQARLDTMNLANAIAAVGGGNDELGRMAANMQQIKTVGKASAMDIKQFAFAGINIYKLLSDATGKSIDQVKDMDVSYELLSKSLQHAASQGGAYFGALENQSKTVSGKWSTFMDGIKMKAADFGVALQPLMHFFLDAGIAITDNLSKMMPYIQPVIDALNNIPNLIGNITGSTGAWMSYLGTIKQLVFVSWATIKSIGGNVWHIVSGVFEWVGKSVLLRDLFWAIGKFGEGILWVIKGNGNTISWIWDNVIKPILNAVEWVYKTAKSLLGGKTEIGITQVVKPVNVPTSNTPATPGIDPTKFTPAGSGVKAGGLDDGGKSRSKADGINSGGQRAIHITIGKQIEKLEVHVMNAKEGAQEIESVVREAMRRVLYSMNGVAS